MNEERCNQCGGSLILDEEKGVYICEYCGTEFPLPVEAFKRIELKRKEKLKAEAKEKHKERNKKRRKKALVFIIVFFIISCAALIIYGNSFRITDAHMTIDTGSDNYSNTIHTYTPNLDEFRVAFTVHNAPENTFISFVWKNKSDILQKSIKYDISNKKNDILTAYLLNDQQVWEVGSYSVEIYINDNIEPIEILNFTVRKNISDIILTDFQMTTSVDDELHPIDTVTEYPTDAQRFMLFGKLFNASFNTTIKYVWKYNGDSFKTDFDSAWEYPNMRFYRSAVKESHLRCVAYEHWLPGSYSVELYVNDETTPSEIVNFKVVK